MLVKIIRRKRDISTHGDYERPGMRVLGRQSAQAALALLESNGGRSSVKRLLWRVLVRNRKLVIASWCLKEYYSNRETNSNLQCNPLAADFHRSPSRNCLQPKLGLEP